MCTRNSAASRGNLSTECRRLTVIRVKAGNGAGWGEGQGEGEGREEGEERAEGIPESLQL